MLDWKFWQLDHSLPKFLFQEHSASVSVHCDESPEHWLVGFIIAHFLVYFRKFCFISGQSFCVVDKKENLCRFQPTIVLLEYSLRFIYP